MRKYILAFLCCAGTLTGMAQMKNTIRGRVVQGETGAAISGASVFITNTSRGTVSDSSGAFELLNVPDGSYDLIVSSIGFETQAYTYKAEQLPLRLEVRLKPRVEELQTVVVEPDEKNGWQRFGQFFIDNFIGTNENGRYCRIKNYNTLRFRYSQKKGILKVLADEPLIIENKALGYRVKYQLENFYFNYKNRMLIFYGYSLFSELDEKGPSRRQLRNREKAWNGSIMHFMYSLYHDSLAAEGFEVRRMTQRPNEEKQRVRQVYREAMKVNEPVASDNLSVQRLPGIGIVSTRPATRNRGISDSSAYYNNVLRQPDIISEYGKTLLTADSLLTTTGTKTKSLFFTNYLYIVYKKEDEDWDYLRYTGEGRQPYSIQRSSAFLPDSTAVTIAATGNYYPPQSFMTLGYWAWDEKIGNLLPLDYRKYDK